MFDSIKKIFKANFGDKRNSLWSTPRQKIVILASKFKEDYIESEFLGDIPMEFKEILFPMDKDLENTEVSVLAMVFLEYVRKAHIVRILLDNAYLEPLAHKCKQLVFKDDYGDTDFSAWESELERFISSKRSAFYCDQPINSFYEKMDVDFENYEYEYLSPYDETEKDILIRLSELIGNVVFDYRLYLIESQNVTEGDLDGVTDPYEYEHAIAETLSNLGWSARATSGSGDQGLDVIATKNGIKFVIQCKLYSQPVGNKAVQEIHAGMGYADADIAAVVTNNTYTKSAKQLAQSLGVHLLHHDQLVDFSTSLVGCSSSEEINSIEEDDSYYFEPPNIVDIAKINGERLELLGWISSHEEDQEVVDGVGYDGTLVVSKGDCKVVLFCTYYDDKPVGIQEVKASAKVFMSPGNTMNFSIVTSSTGFTDEALEFLEAQESMMGLDNDQIDAVDGLADGFDG